MYRFLILSFLMVPLLISTRVLAQADGDAWASLLRATESLLGDDGTIAADDKIDAIVDLHATFCREVLRQPISSQRLVAVKLGLRGFLQTAVHRYSGNQRQAILRLLRDLSANRAVFSELLSSDVTPELVEQQLLAYLERNQSLGYKEPVPIAAQLSAGAAHKDLTIVEDEIRMIADKGSAGHGNGAIDAGETVTLNIPLRNESEKSYRSTSAFLRTDDRFVRADVSEAIYTERSTVDGKTVVFAPGTTIVPRQSFTFTILPDCPDRHVVSFDLLVWDSDQGKFTLPLNLTVYRVGPLDFGVIRVDDDVPGFSNGNGDGAIDAGETIEYVLALQNRGAVNIDNVSATLFSPLPQVVFEHGFDELQYGNIEANRQEPVSASFVFAANAKANDGTAIPEELFFRLLVNGTARGHSYSWIQTRYHVLGIRDDVLAKARRDPLVFALEIRRPALFYRRVEIENRTAVIKELRGSLSANHRVDDKILPEIQRVFVDKRNDKVSFSLKEVGRKGKMRSLPDSRHPTSREVDCDVFLQISVGSGSKKVDKEIQTERISTWIREGYAGTQGYEAEHRNTIQPKVDSEYHDLAPLRFVFAREKDNDRLFVFVYRLDLGDRLVPTSVSDPAEVFGNADANHRYTFEYEEKDQ